MIELLVFFCSHHFSFIYILKYASTWNISPILADCFWPLWASILKLLRLFTFRPKKISCLFPVTLPYQVFIQKNPYPKVFSTLQTPNQRKTCIKDTFLTKKIKEKKKLPTYLPYFFWTVTGNKQFLFLGLIGQVQSFVLICTFNQIGS